MAMNLKNKFVLWCAVLLAGVVVLGSVSVWHLWSLQQSAVAAAAEYDAMDRAEALAVRVAWLRDCLHGANARSYKDEKYFRSIHKEAEVIVRQLRLASAVEDGDGAAELDLGQSALDHLDAA